MTLAANSFQAFANDLVLLMLFPTSRCCFFSPTESLVKLNPASFVLKVTQDGTGSRTITWPSTVDWASATAPTLSTGAADVDVFVFFTIDGGTIYYGFPAGQDMS